MNNLTPVEGRARSAGWSRRVLLKRAGLALGAVLPWALGGCRRSETHTVEMISNGGEEMFVPDRLRIRPGDSVKWVLTSGFHSATAYHPANAGHPLRIPESAAAWDSGLLRVDGEHFEVTFEHEGAYNYYCTPHEALGMVGVVVVGNVRIREPALHPPPPELPNAARETLNELIGWASRFQS